MSHAKHFSATAPRANVTCRTLESILMISSFSPNPRPGSLSKSCFDHVEATIYRITLCSFLSFLPKAALSFLLHIFNFLAMSETMSGPSDWLQFYHQNLPNQVTSPGHPVSGALLDNRVSDATVVSTTVTSPTTLSSLGSGSSIPDTGGHLSPEGRVSKPIRRRSRASRRTPTTLLNTDTTNFRAMVQQFTGGPSAPFASGAHAGAPNFGFGLGTHQAGHVNNPTAMMMPPGRGYHLQPQTQLYHPQSQQYMFSLGSNNAQAGDPFLQRLGSSRSRNIGVSDGFVMEGVSSSSQVPSARPSGSSDENRTNSYMF
ncbi:VQ motif-containing protein 22-like [Juglans microcarpa x Juglans regia]|uniref:VQ motif-containing protein 22-like n=1 Tax=Juglans microcarpa x Juglans regia TaxID=2249226 RepID=UPI001B7E220E|nr:VQ motif-containing protein 22-like [Juglans microcarpa x Juglans regia]